MQALKSTVITDGIAIVVQAQSGTLSRRPVDKVRQHLLRSAASVESAYLAGEITAQDVLLQGATHFDNEKVIQYLTTIEEVAVPEGEGEEDEADDLHELRELPDPIDIDERQAVLNADEGLQDVDEDPWVTTVWPSAARGKDRKWLIYSR